jgi:hypothetical protein
VGGGAGVIFKSRQVNLDPKPYDLLGVRYESENGVNAHAASQPRRFDPRPEFEPTRDPYPWARVGADGAVNGYSAMPYVGRLKLGERFEFRPRRDLFDTPINPILVAFRKDAQLSGFDTALAAYMGEITDPYRFNRGMRYFHGAEAADHARRVLSRLVSFEAMQSNGGI